MQPERQGRHGYSDLPRWASGLASVVLILTLPLAASHGAPPILISLGIVFAIGNGIYACRPGAR